MNKNINKEPIELYRKRDFQKLCKRGLQNIVDVHKNTIIHHIAKNLDSDALHQIYKINPDLIVYETMNPVNVLSQTPLNIALERIEELGLEDYSFIDLMIDYGANCDIPDKYGRTIKLLKDVEKDNKENVDNLYKEKMERLNANIIEKLTELRNEAYEYGNIYNSNCEVTNYFTEQSKDMNPDKVIDMLAQEYRQKGGRKKNDFYVSEYGSKNSFDISNKREIMNEYDYLYNQDRVSRDPEGTVIFNNVLKRIMELMGLDEKEAGYARTALKLYVLEKNPELKKRENDLKKMKEIEKLVVDKKTLKNVLDTMDVQKIKEYTLSQKKKSEEERKKREKGEKKGEKKVKGKSKKKDETSESIDISSISSSEKPSKKSSKKASKKSSKKEDSKYAKSDDISTES